jgi:hypothetical protein
MLAEVQPGAATFRVEGLPELLYLRGRLKSARYNARLLLSESGSDYFDATWRGRDDEEDRPLDFEPKTEAWPPGWPPPLPDGVSEAGAAIWFAQVDSPGGRPASVAFGIDGLTEWIRLADRHIVLRDAPPLLEGKTTRLSISPAFREQMKVSHALERFSKYLGDSPLDRMRLGERHERDRLRLVRSAGK